jgi:hypothetical protein
MFKKLLLLLPCGLVLAMAISFLDARCGAQTQLGTVSLQNNGSPVQCPSGGWPTRAPLASRRLHCGCPTRRDFRRVGTTNADA